MDQLLWVLVRLMVRRMGMICRGRRMRFGVHKRILPCPAENASGDMSQSAHIFLSPAGIQNSVDIARLNVK